MEVEPTRMCELLVGLGDVEVVGIDDEAGEPLRVHIRCQTSRPDCGACGTSTVGTATRSRTSAWIATPSTSASRPPQHLRPLSADPNGPDVGAT